MRIAYITSKLPFGHGETFIISELNNLLLNAHEVMIIPMYPRGPVLHETAEPLLRHTVKTNLFSIPVFAGAASEFLRAPMRSLRALGLLFQSRSPSVFGRNLAVYCKGLWLAGQLRAWKAEHIHSHWANTPSTMALIASEVSGIPFSVTAHRGDITDDNLLTLKLRRARFTRFISEDGIATAKRLNVFTRETGEVVMLHMGIVLPARPASQAPVKNSRTVILCAAHLIPRKGHAYLLEAFAMLVRRGFDVFLELAGEGPDRGILEEKVAALGIRERVRFLGLVSHPDLLRHYAEGKVDMVVLPTLHEGIPVSLMEAMSFEIPVVSTETGGIPELLQGGAGILVPPQSVSALADALASLLLNKEEAARVAKVGRTRIEQEYDVREVGSRLLEYFQGAVCTDPSMAMEDASVPIP